MPERVWKKEKVLRGLITRGLFKKNPRKTRACIPGEIPRAITKQHSSIPRKNYCSTSWCTLRETNGGYQDKFMWEFLLEILTTIGVPNRTPGWILRKFLKRSLEEWQMESVDFFEFLWWLDYFWKNPGENFTVVTVSSVKKSVVNFCGVITWMKFDAPFRSTGSSRTLFYTICESVPWSS